MPESKLLMDIGDRLRARREKMGLTLVRKHLELDPTYLITGEHNSNQLIERLMEECPKGKEDLVIQLMHYLALLYR